MKPSVVASITLVGIGVLGATMAAMVGATAGVVLSCAAGGLGLLGMLVELAS